ncbi:MAG: hypothetical protein QOD63_202, partial [Actinomycetota bacterium]|nr:hypothetical protein [Actinomycetota bacterium]
LASLRENLEANEEAPDRQPPAPGGDLSEAERRLAAIKSQLLKV